MQISVLNHKVLDTRNAISLHNQSPKQSDELKKIEEQFKEIQKNKLPVKLGGNASIDPSEIKVTVTGEMAHFNFINDIEELSEDEKKNISRLIQQSVKKPNGGTGDYFIMDRAQTSTQLQYIADKLIPEKYKDEMNEAIKNYQEEGYNLQVKIYEVAQAKMDELVAKFPSLGEKSIMANGIKTLEEQEKAIYNLYSELDLSSQTNFVQSFENVLTKFKENQQQLKNSPTDVLHKFQDELRTKWNDFASVLNDATVYKLPTADKSLFDFRL